MKKSKFTESQITASIKAYEAGKDVQQICRELKINGEVKDSEILNHPASGYGKTSREGFTIIDSVSIRMQHVTAPNNFEDFRH